MNFEQAQQHYAELRRRVQAGQLTAEQFATAAAQLRVQDGTGRWWQIDPSSGQWLFWDGAAWKPASPPSAVLAPSILPASDSEVRAAQDRGLPARPAATPASAPAGGPASQQASAPNTVDQALRKIQQRTVDLPTFLRESKQTPLAKRSQGWWDLFAILGGLLGGYLWFVYSSVRGLPTPQFIDSGWGTAFFGLLPALGLLLIPVLLVVFRKAVGNFWESLGKKYPPVVRKLLLSLPLIIAVTLYFWSCVDPWIYPKLFRPAREPLDIITPFLVMAMPLLLVWFREPIDAILQPIQPLRRNIPRPVLVAVGLLTPFAMAYILYALGPYTPVPGWFTMFPYMRISCVASTLVSYVILRTPVPRIPAGGRAVAGLAGQAMRAMPTLLLLAGLGILLYHGGAWADDFLSDPFNLNDGLRTPGWAPIIAGTATSIVTVLVNGAEVIRVVIVDPNPPSGADGATGADGSGAATGTAGGAEGGGKQVNFQVIVDSVGATGARSTELAQGVNETIYIYAHCTKEGAPFPQGDTTITFMPNFDQTFVTLTDMGTQNGRRCASVALVLPAPAGTPPTSITVMVGAGQAVPAIPLTLSVQVSEYLLELR